MDFDKVLVELGEFGAWQRYNALLLWLPSIAAGMNIMVNAFSVMQPKEFRCANACDTNSSSFDLINGAEYSLGDLFPSFDNKSNSYNTENPNYCKFYPPHLDDSEKCTFDKSVIAKCTAGSTYLYQDFEMKSSVATDNDLVCGKLKWIPTIDSFMMIGLLVGSFVFGVMSDKIGRRHTLLISVLCCAVGNLLGSLMPNHWSYAITRVLASAGGEGAFVLAFTMSLEYAGVAEKVPCVPWVTFSTLLANLISIPFALGEMLPVLFAMGLKNWKNFQYAVSGTMFAAAFVWFLLPESPRWLIANNKHKEAKEVIEKAAKINKKTISKDLLEIQETPKSEEKNEPLPQYGLSDMFRRSQLQITLVMFVCWPVITLLYYGLTLSADKIKMTENLYLSFILVALIEIPAYFILPVVIDIWGRKPLFCLTQLVPGILCIVAAFLTPGTAIFAILTLASKLGAAMAFNVTFMYTAQLYPTTIRNSAVGTCSTIARLGGLLSPWVGKYLTDPVAFEDPIPEYVPLCLFGGFGVLGGLCALLLPDTIGSKLPNTFEDIENIKKNSKPIWKCGAPQNE